MGGGGVFKNCAVPVQNFSGVAFCTILISELSHHVFVTFCTSFGIFPHVLSLEITYALSYL